MTRRQPPELLHTHLIHLQERINRGAEGLREVNVEMSDRYEAVSRELTPLIEQAQHLQSELEQAQLRVQELLNTLGIPLRKGELVS